MGNFIKRLLTGIVYVSLIVASVYTNEFLFFAIFAIIMTMSLYEFYKLIAENTSIKPQTVIGIVSAILLYSISFSDSFQILGVSLLPIAILFPLGMFIYELYRNLKTPIHNVALSFLGVLYIGVPFAVLPMLAYSQDSSNHIMSELVLAMFVFIWANDSFAYVWGVTLGKHKLFPRISPKKSVEGFIGGMLSTVGIAILVSKYYSQDLSLGEWIGAALVIVVFATFGDLTESMFKRNLNVKDSSNMLPGHGGFLDRFDSVVFCIPAFFAYLHFIN